MVWYEGTGTSDKRFIISDHQGSVIATKNAAGSVLNISTYSPYGERTNTNAAYASRFGYTGQADLPELNLQYYKARIYDPKLGRFLQSDPIGYEAGMNIYAYVLGDPVNATDPLGLEVEATITAPRLTDDQKCERQYGAGNCYSGGGEYTLPFWVREERPSDFDGVPDFIIPQYGKGGGGGKSNQDKPKPSCKPNRMILFSPNDRYGMPYSNPYSVVNPFGDFLVAGHGGFDKNGNEFRMLDENGSFLSSSALASRIASDAGYNGSSVTLGGCNVGQSPEYVQGVANALGVCVRASFAKVAYPNNGSAIFSRATQDGKSNGWIRRCPQ